jgi:hypothetical protein
MQEYEFPPPASSRGRILNIEAVRYQQENNRLSGAALEQRRLNPCRLLRNVADFAQRSTNCSQETSEIDERSVEPPRVPLLFRLGYPGDRLSWWQRPSH